MSTCSHLQHSFDVYGKTIYSIQTCKKCLLTAYQRKPLRNDELLDTLMSTMKHVKVEKELPYIKMQAQTPLVETISHFPSPGGEATYDVYQPHLPLVNQEEEIRPKEVSKFVEKLTLEDKELVERCKSPWEIDRKEEELYDDHTPTSSISPAEKKISDAKIIDNLKNDEEKLHRVTTGQFYKTTTQRLYEGVNWKDILSPSRTPPLPPSRHDTRDLYGQRRKYNTKTASFQRCNQQWDICQSRDGYFVKRPIAFCSIAKKSNQIPNYQGSISGMGEKDIENEVFTPATVVRTQLPKYQETSRKPYIPGYTGCVAWATSRDVLSREKQPRAESTARTHSRFSIYPENTSAHSHRSPLARTVTLTNPYVPFNNMAHPLNRTASGNRVY